MTRDEIADKILELFLPNPERWLLDEIVCMDDAVADALHDMLFKGPQRMSASGGEATRRVLTFLRGFYWVYCRDWKDGKEAVSYTFAVPEEIRALFKKEDDFEGIRSLGGDIVAYACSAATLYGVVSFEELQGLIDRYCPATHGETLREGQYWFDMDFLKPILQGRATSTDCGYILRNNWICHAEFAAEKEKPDELIDMFVEVRDRHERWYPAGEDEFLSFESDFFFLDMPECEKQEDFLDAHGMTDEDGRVDALYDVVCRLQIDVERPGILMQGILDKLKNMEGEETEAEFCALWMSLVNRIHRRNLNGWSPEEAYARERQKDSRPLVIKVNRRAAVGRNDPCTCGSGKKFKKCCGMKTKKAKAISKLAKARLDVYLPMREKTSRFVSRHVVPMNGMRELHAAAERLGIMKDGEPSEINEEVHAAVVGDYAAMMDDQFGLPPIKRMIERDSKFKGDDAGALEMFRQYRYTWLEVLNVEPGVGVTCRDLLTGETGFLMETSFSRDLGVCGMTVCAGIGQLPNGTWMILGTIHPSNFENPSVILKIVLTHLSLPTELPVTLSFADQARFAAETVKRINANGRFGSLKYGCMT